MQVSSEDGGPRDDHTVLQQDLLSEAETCRRSSSSEGSLAALFYPPLPHEKAVAGTAVSTSAAGTPRRQIRRPDTQIPPFSASSAQGIPRRQCTALVSTCSEIWAVLPMKAVPIKIVSSRLFSIT